MNTLFGTESGKYDLVKTNIENMIWHGNQTSQVIVMAILTTHLEYVTDYAVGSAVAGRVSSGPVV